MHSTVQDSRLNQYPSGKANAMFQAKGAASSGILSEVTQPTRNSGGKRDLERSAATDTLNLVANSHIDPSSSGPAAKKKKITYALPHQNMEEGHFYVVLGEDVDVSTGRFKILSLLGEGTFGKVVEAWDRKRKEYCAVKVVRNIPKYSRDAQVEIKYMERVRASDANDQFCFMKIQRYFVNDTQHQCIVMPKYGPCLLDHLQKHGPFPYRHLAEIIFQSGIALDYFHTELRLMHTDLKPENMLLESGTLTTDAITGKSVPTLPCEVRLCDLGGCCDERHSRNAIVSTRHYRSPEVILGLGWMFSTDMWSMGCIIYELATARLLYDTHDNLEHLHLMEKTLGRLPADFQRNCTDEARQMYQPQSTSLKPVTEPKSIARVGRARQVRDVIAEESLQNLILGLLHYDRTKRTTARQMATHPFVQKYFPECLQHPLHPVNRGPLPPMPSC